MARAWHRLPLQAYLVGLVGAIGTVAGVSVIYQWRHNVDAVVEATATRVQAQADFAADLITDAIDIASANVAQLAANPELAATLDELPDRSCSLTFGGSGPFTEGHIDILRTDGTVRCSSRPPPPGPAYAQQDWLDQAGAVAAVHGPLVDPVSGQRGVFVAAGFHDHGVVAAFLSLDGVEARLEASLGGAVRTQFRLDEPGTRPPPAAGSIAATSELDVLDGALHASVQRADAVGEVDAINQRTLLVLASALLAVLGATHLVYRRIGRPIEALSASARRISDGDLREPELPSRGPAEVLSLAEDFRALARSIGEEFVRREEAERTARASEESYRTLFAANPLPMWIYDAETLLFLEVNDAAVAAYGWSRDEFLQMTLGEIRPPEEVPALLEKVASTAPLERSGLWHHCHKDGQVVEVEITSHSLTFEGRPARFVMAEDVTDRRRTQRLLEQVERMESLGQLAGGIAHDFNNVLAVILGHAEFVEEALAVAASTDPQRWQPVLDDARHISGAAARAARLTRQLLSFARGGTTEAAAVDINEVLTNLEPMLRSVLGTHIALRTRLAENLPLVLVDAGQLEQVVVNLAVNARDAMPAGGDLSIETVWLDIDEHHGIDPVLGRGRYVRLRVSDTGIGMTPEVRDRAFEPLFTTKERGAGTGFGLATVYGVVARHGGTARIYSEPGIGTTVSVLFPATDQKPVATPTEHLSGEVGTGTILVVEDDDEIRSVAKRILAAHGYEVLTAQDAASALAVAQQRPGDIDLLLTDVIMPGILGTELAVRLQTLEPRMRVMLMSGYSPPVLTSGGYLPADTPILDKPFSAASLVNAVRRALASAVRDIDSSI